MVREIEGGLAITLFTAIAKFLIRKSIPIILLFCGLAGFLDLFGCTLVHGTSVAIVGPVSNSHTGDDTMFDDDRKQVVTATLDIKSSKSDFIKSFTVLCDSASDRAVEFTDYNGLAPNQEVRRTYTSDDTGSYIIGMKDCEISHVDYGKPGTAVNVDAIRAQQHD